MTIAWHVRGLGLLALSACGTLGNKPSGSDGLPNALAGPFRPLRPAEVASGLGPYVLEDDSTFVRDVSVVPLSGAGSESMPAPALAVVAFAARARFAPQAMPDPTAPTTEIVRTTAADGRSFGLGAEVVLTAEGGWESGAIGAPTAIRLASGWLLYYAGAGGIGLARSSDGAAFTRDAHNPVLAPAASGWDADLAPRSPAVVQEWDGTLRLFYAVKTARGNAIGEASSTDGVTWARKDAPVLVPGDGYDAGGVDGPYPVRASSPLGRDLLWLYYGATDAGGKRAIGAAARDLGGSFVRAAAPVFGTGGALGPAEPCAVRFDGFSLLFATERAGTAESNDYPAVAAGVAPATLDLPSPTAM